MLVTRYTALAATPVTDGDYAGPDVRYSSEFEQIENALQQEGSIHRNGGPDWTRIVEQGEQLLQSQSKDLRVACWLAWALYRTNGTEGLQAGLALLRNLLDHWDALHPRKPRTRSAALTWFANRLESAMPEILSGKPDSTVWPLLAEALSDLDLQLNRLLEDQAPLLQPLCRQLKARAAQDAPPTAAAAPSTAPQTASVTPLAQPVENPVLTGSTVGADPIISPRDAHKGLRALQEQARSLCQWWQTQSIVDSRAIALSRTCLWLPIEALPEHDKAGKTGLRGLPADRQQSFQERLAQGQPAELLRDVESSVARAPFWLDGQYLAWRCLDELRADAARRELELQLGGFLRRLPGIEHLQFFDGTPFADQQTLGWIATSVLTDSTPGAGVATEPSSDEPWETALGEATTLLRSDGLQAAMASLQAGIATARGGRARLHWQLAVARLCMQAGKHELARSLLEGMEQTLREARLGDWEPQLLVRVLRLLLKTHEQTGGKAGRERRDEIFQRLCHLDFEVVLEQALGP